MNSLDLHKFESLPSVQVNRQQIADARGVELVLNGSGLQGRSFLGLQAVTTARASGDGGGFGQVEHFRQVLGRIESKFLAVEIADGWMSFNDDSRLGAVNAARPGSLHAYD